jgi:hypothetical protein
LRQARGRLIKNNKKGMVIYERAVKFCKENFSDMLPKDDEET